MNLLEPNESEEGQGAFYRQIAQAVPGSQLEVIEGAGQLVQEDRPTELNEILYGWLSSLHPERP